MGWVTIWVTLTMLGFISRGIVQHELPHARNDSVGRRDDCDSAGCSCGHTNKETQWQQQRPGVGNHLTAD